MKKNYNIPEDKISVAEESVAVYIPNRQHGATSKLTESNAKQKQMRDYCRTHFDEAFVTEMEAKNFLINTPQPTNESDFEDLDKMFEDSEASGECTEEEVTMMFAV